MNTYTQEERTGQRARNSLVESESIVVQLSHTYAEMGLAPGDAWDAALADYYCVFNAVTANAA